MAANPNPKKSVGNPAQDESDEISDDDLETVTGGTAAVVTPVEKKTVVSPRDPASGLPTGKRMH